jgi:hypothetical protein
MKENMENAPSQSDYVTLKKFNIKDFNVELRDVENKLRTYGVVNIDTSQSEWRNIINVIDKLTKLNITVQNLDDFTQLMRKFGVTNITEWYDVLNKLTEIKIQNYNNIKIFIELITNFNVSYKTNFDDFIQTMNIFKPDLSVSLDPIIGFIGDMTTIGFKYDTNSTDVRNMVSYFSACKFTLTTYKSAVNPSSLNGFTCNNEATSINKTIIGLPSKIVMSFYSYNTANGIFNDLTDLKMPSVVKNTPYCDVIYAMQQAYMVANNLSNYNAENTLISPNVINIAAFFYKEEFDNILNNINAYSYVNKRIELMTGISDGMINYANTFKSDPSRQNTYEEYNKLASIIRLFPSVIFQYMSNEFISKCSSGNKCLYHVTVDPVYSECKASTKNKTINYRLKDPVL